MRILVCGTENFNNRDLLYRALDDVHSRSPITCVIRGSGGGAEALAARWGRERGIYAMGFKAEWTKHKKSAGPIRNDRMIKKGRPDLVLVFGAERNTGDIGLRATKAGIPVTVVRPD